MDFPPSFANTEGIALLFSRSLGLHDGWVILKFDNEEHKNKFRLLLKQTRAIFCPKQMSWKVEGKHLLTWNSALLQADPINHVVAPYSPLQLRLPSTKFCLYCLQWGHETNSCPRLWELTREQPSRTRTWIIIIAENETRENERELEKKEREALIDEWWWPKVGHERAPKLRREKRKRTIME